jgi:hypothetical protein
MRVYLDENPPQSALRIGERFRDEPLNIRLTPAPSAGDHRGLWRRRRVQHPSELRWGTSKALGYLVQEQNAIHFVTRLAS